MKEPIQYYLRDLETGDFKPFTGIGAPCSHHCEEYRPIDATTSKLVQVREVWENRRYYAELRLYRMLKRKRVVINLSINIK